jgi:hypothetical protein
MSLKTTVALPASMVYAEVLVVSLFGTIERKNDIEPDTIASLLSLLFGPALHQSRINMLI